MAKRLNFPKIRGFEFFPAGKLLSQHVDFACDVGIAYERCVGYTKPPHSHDRITITFPRGSSRSFVKTYPEARTYRLHHDVVHLMAQDCEHEQGSYSTIYDTFAIFVTEDYCRRHLADQGFKRGEIDSFLKKTQTLKRSAILKEAIDRYFVLRVLQADGCDQAEKQHLETVLLNELFSLGRRSETKEPSRDARSVSLAAPADGDEVALTRAVEFIESHLFEPLDVPSLVASARTSQATLFRLFKRHLRSSPIEYVRNRRMDEARTLLKSGQYQVGDVALLVGYGDLSTFSKAFKARFRTPPSRALKLSVGKSR